MVRSKSLSKSRSLPAAACRTSPPRPSCEHRTFVYVLDGLLRDLEVGPGGLDVGGLAGLRGEDLLQESLHLVLPLLRGRGRGRRKGMSIT